MKTDNNPTINPRRAERNLQDWNQTDARSRLQGMPLAERDAVNGRPAAVIPIARPERLERPPGVAGVVGAWRHDGRASIVLGPVEDGQAAEPAGGVAVERERLLGRALP